MLIFLSNRMFRKQRYVVNINKCNVGLNLHNNNNNNNNNNNIYRGSPTRQGGFQWGPHTWWTMAAK